MEQLNYAYNFDLKGLIKEAAKAPTKVYEHFISDDETTCYDVSLFVGIPILMIVSMIYGIFCA